MSTSLLKVHSPYTQDELGSMSTLDWPAVSEKLGHALDTFQNRKQWLPVHERVGVLERTTRLMMKHHAKLAMQIAKEGGKPLKDALVETTRAIDGVRLAIETIRTEAGHVVPMNSTMAAANKMAMTQLEPIGVVVAVSAFNHPLNLIVHQVASAVAAGCPVLVKPANDTPLSCQNFVDLLIEAGLPEAWCQCVITHDRSVAEALVTDPRVSFFSFIGSPTVGWSLRSKLAPGTRCSLEHGGAAPVILNDSSNLQATVGAITKGGFYHAGQVCVSVQRVYVHEAIANDFLEVFKKTVGQLIVGDPMLMETDVGPLIREAEVTRVDSWVKEAIEQGADLICGGNTLGKQCYAPTILLNPDAESAVSQKEIFGPVVCVYTYRSIDDAIERANSLPFAFQAAVFTAELETAMHCYKNLNASAVMVNDHSAFRVDNMPFAGLKQSGLGVGGIQHTIRDMQIEKMLVLSI
jgi:acyl-CoA reductase-like NAD-dependent aldehyde dehydrogenase